MKNVSIVTLGCSKNDIDSAQMESILDENQYSYTEDVHEANIIVVNTCGFIDSAKEESIDTILSLAQLKERGDLEYLLIAGCLAQRYPDELLEEIPEADGIIGPGYLSSINEALSLLEEGRRVNFTEIISTPYNERARRKYVAVSEYVKISEGCNNNCTYCIIPKLKGTNRSRKIEDIVEEIQDLTARGAREIILIGQNTTDYGIDVYGEYRLKELLHSLREIPNLKWVRILYAYPDHFSDDLIDEMRDNPKILPYIDIPMQHISNSVLKRMGRRTSKEEIVNLIEKLRNEIPDIVIRSTFLLGFPGETDNDFNELIEFIENYPIDRVGSFVFSLQEETAAAHLEPKVPESVAEQRQEIFMKRQEEISTELLKKWIGLDLEVLITESVEPGLYLGRSKLDAPDVDGLVYIRTNEDLELDQFAHVRITDSLEFDLIGDFIEYSK